MLNAALWPILMGYGFVIVGALIAACATRKGLLKTGSPPANPFALMFVTGLWAGLMLGGLGLIFYVSPTAGLLTVGILLGARLLAVRGRGKRAGGPGE